MKIKIFGYELTVELKRKLSDKWIYNVIVRATEVAQDRGYSIWSYPTNTFTWKINRIKAICALHDPYPKEVIGGEDGVPSFNYYPGEKKSTLSSAKYFVERYWSNE
jgi:hypothetical protein